MALDLVNSAEDRVRLKVGDIHTIPFLTQDVYTYLLNKNDANEIRAAKEAAMAILALLTKSSRERAGDIEVYGQDFFKNYKDFLHLFLINPNTSLDLAMPYFGNVSKADFDKNTLNPDNLSISTPYQEDIAPFYPDITKLVI